MQSVVGNTCIAATIFGADGHVDAALPRRQAGFEQPPPGRQSQRIARRQHRDSVAIEGAPHRAHRAIPPPQRAERKRNQQVAARQRDALRASRRVDRRCFRVIPRQRAPRRPRPIRAAHAVDRVATLVGARQCAILVVDIVTHRQHRAGLRVILRRHIAHAFHHLRLIGQSAATQRRNRHRLAPRHAVIHRYGPMHLPEIIRTADVLAHHQRHAVGQYARARVKPRRPALASGENSR